ncbi:MAG: uracil-xanthine permease family protein, partial [Desulfitobacteriaceae bacterium]
MSSEKVIFKYGIDDRPAFWKLTLFGLQWLAVAIPMILIIGRVGAGLQYSDPLNQILYIQRMFFVTGIALLAEVFLGHRLPIVIGPAAVLLVGVTAGQGNNPAAAYSAILIGGLLLFLLSITGLFAYIKRLFTPRVVAATLILIAFTLTPMISNQIFNPADGVAQINKLGFAGAFVFALFWVNRRLSGLWKATLIIWGILLGSGFYALLFRQHLGLDAGETWAGVEKMPVFGPFWQGIHFQFVWDPGVFIAFMICYVALAINDLGSIQVIGELLQPGDMEKRITRGMALTGLGNVLSGLFGVIGPVNFSLSPGVIFSTGVASRFALVPAGAGLVLLGFFPRAVAFVGTVPSVIIGSALLYIMTSQIAASLQALFGNPQGLKFEDGLVLGLSFMLGIIVSFLPANVVATFPPVL